MVDLIYNSDKYDSLRIQAIVNRELGVDYTSSFFPESIILGDPDKYFKSQGYVKTFKVLESKGVHRFEEKDDPIEYYRDYISLYKKENVIVKAQTQYDIGKKDIVTKRFYHNSSEEVQHYREFDNYRVIALTRIEAYYIKDSAEIYQELFDDLLNYAYRIDSTAEGGKVYMISNSSSGFKLIDGELENNEIDVDLYYDEELSKNFDGLIERMKEDRAGMVLLHGEPGTGKSHLIKEITRRLGDDKKCIFMPAKMVEILANPDCIEFLLDHKGAIIIIEDAENVLQKRNPNSGQSTSNILQLSSGLLGDVGKFQIIATFNSDFENIDDAILRKGRCFFRHQFEKLPAEQVDRICSKLDINPIGEPATLAEIFNHTEKDFANLEKKSVIGF